MASFTYTLDIQPTQDDLQAYLDSEIDCDIVVDGVLDDASLPIPSVVLWFRGLRRAGSGRGTRAMSTPRLDSYNSGFDLICVADNPTTARTMLNSVNDLLIGYKPVDAGYIYPDGSLWENSRSILEAQNRPSRWAATARFGFGVLQSRVEVP